MSYRTRRMGVCGVIRLTNSLLAKFMVRQVLVDGSY